MTAPDTVLVAGSLHYDIVVLADHLPRRDETAVGRRWFPKCGGKGGNQAAAVVRAGARARMAGAIGGDAFGADLRAGLRSSGVEDAFVLTLPGLGSGMSVAMVDDAGDYAAAIVSGANLGIPLDLPGRAALWEGVGLVLLQNEVADAFNIAVARAARERGVRTLLNAAPARAIPPELGALVDILVVNAVEAEMMGAGPVRDLASAARAAARLAERFGRAIVTCGAAGLALRSADGEAVALPAERVNVVSTHGAGDTFVGTLAAGLLRGGTLEEGCRAAAAAAARHVSGQ